ncbi:hypothetical protein E4U22_001261, partial [Claviceps purpurea]
EASKIEDSFEHSETDNGKVSEVGTFGDEGALAIKGRVPSDQRGEEIAEAGDTSELGDDESISTLKSEGFRQS